MKTVSSWSKRLISAMIYFPDFANIPSPVKYDPRNHGNQSRFAVPIPLPVYVRSKSPPNECSAKQKKCRRSRTVFTELQLMGLEKKFKNHKYLSTPDRITLADTLGLSQLQVKTWYQNRRMKWKKEVSSQEGSLDRGTWWNRITTSFP